MPLRRREAPRGDHPIALGDRGRAHNFMERVSEGRMMPDDHYNALEPHMKELMDIEGRSATKELGVCQFTRNGDGPFRTFILERGKKRIVFDSYGHVLAKQGF